MADDAGGIRLRGDNPAGDGLTLARPDGTTALSYAGLLAWDATGRVLPASLEVRPDGAGQDLSIHVETEGAEGPITIDPFVQQAILTPSDAYLSGAVAISGNTVVLGASDATIGGNSEQGAAYVFQKPASGWVNMTQTAKLTASDAAVGDLLGRSVAISGDTVVAGASQAKIAAGAYQVTAGAAYVFQKPGSVWSDMTQTAKLTASDGGSLHYFGHSAAISGDTIVVGAPYARVEPNSEQGAAYVFQKPIAGWSNMTETALLTNSGGVVADHFGKSVAIDGDTLVVGATGCGPSWDPIPGSAYVFVKPSAGWATMTETAKLSASDGVPRDYFGESVGISGGRVVVTTSSVAVHRRKAYVFDEPSGGWTDMTETTQLTPAWGWFGGIAIDGDTIVEGAGHVFRSYVAGTVAWINPEGGTWGTPGNWSTGTVPAPGDDVVIDTASPATIVIQPDDTVVIHSLTTGAHSALSMTGGSLSVEAESTINGGLSIAGGAVDFAGGTTFNVAQAATLTLDRGTYSGGTTFNVPQGSAVDIGGGTFTGGTAFHVAAGGTVDLFSGTFAGGTTFDVAASGALHLQGGTYNDGTTLSVGAGATAGISGGTLAGLTTFNVAAATTVDITGVATYSGMLAGSGEGTVQLGGGTFRVGLGGATLNFPGNMFQWTGGQIEGGLGELTNVGTIHLAGPNRKEILASGTLNNFGTIIHTGSGYLDLHSDGGSPTILRIEPGGLYLLESDAGVAHFWGTNVIENAGTIRKTAGTGTGKLSVRGQLINTGTIEVSSGTLELEATTVAQLSGNSLLGGSWNALQGATLKLPAATAVTTNAGNVSLGGAGATITGIAGLSSNSGSFVLTGGADFTTAGHFTNTGSLTLGPGSRLSVAGNYAQTSAATLSVEIGGTPASGLFGQLAAGQTAALAGTFHAAIAGGYTPTTGEVFPAVTFASASGAFDALTGLTPFFTQSLDPTAFNLHASANAVDLVLSGVTAPASATQGQEITVNWQVTVPGTQPASGPWRDSVYFSPTPTITSRSTLLGTVEHEGGPAAGGAYAASLTAAVPALAPGYHYVVVQADSHYEVPDAHRSNNSRAADSGPIDISAPALTLGTPQSGSFTAANQDLYYQVTVPAGGMLQVSLTSTAASGTVALYVGQGAIPTLYNYQAASLATGQPNPAVTMQVLTAGTYYILAHSVSGAAVAAPFSLVVTQTAALGVLGFAPSSGGNAGNVTVQIDGANFTPGATASLALGAATIDAQAIVWDSSSRIYATFNLTGAAVGSYALNVAQGGQSVAAASPFIVVAGDPAALEVSLSVPEFVRAGRTGKIVIGYTNTTANDLVAPLLTVSSTNPRVAFSIPDFPDNYTDWAQVMAVAPTGPAGILRPGQSGQVTLTLLSNSTIDEDPIPVEVSQIVPGEAMDWAAQKDALRPSTTPPAAWDIIWDNFLASVGTTTDSYNAALAADASYLSQFGPPTYDALTLFWFELEKANAVYTPQGPMTFTADSLPAPGMSLSFVQSFQPTIAGRFYQGVLGSGWTTNWDMSASTLPDGNAAIQVGKETSYYLKQRDGSFHAQYGDHCVLSFANGTYRLQFTDGRTFQFNASGKIAYVEDTNGNRITAGYNGSGQLVSLTHSNGESIALAYNAHGRVASLSDSAGRSATYGYDPTGQWLTSFTDAFGTTSYGYVTDSSAARNALSEIAFADNTHVYFGYDARGRLIDQHLDGGAERQTIAYGSTGATPSPTPTTMPRWSSSASTEPRPRRSIRSATSRATSTTPT